MLIKCQECNTDISDKAKCCPKCGCPIQENLIDEEKETENIYSIISLVFFILFVIFGFLVSIIPCALCYIVSKIFAFISYGKDGGTKCADVVYGFNKLVIIVFIIIIVVNIVF